jgi:tetrapyrrole methylase family protein/MazG family protein
MKQFDRFVATIKKLRSPEGCPWDREQTHQSLRPYLIEEVYEVLEAIDSGNPALLKDELGDLLLQIVLHAEIASEEKKFNIEDVAQNVTEKMVRRHPHVFADTKVSGVKDVWQNWEQIKKGEKSSAAENKESILDSIPQSLPALFRASKIQKKAARVGFDWADYQDVLEKIKEEIAEFAEAEASGKQTAIIEEFGDILFSLVNLARKLDIDAENALRLTTNKFEKRFKFIEKKVAEAKKEFKDYSLAELDNFWNEAKKIN